MLEYAKAYDKLGWVVMPIKPNDKRPIIKNWSKYNPMMKRWINSKIPQT